MGMNHLRMLLLALALAGCSAARSREAMSQPSTLTNAPLRNRLRVALEAPVAEVWSLIGDLRRFPEYSAGLERVEVKGNTEYVCHFKPQEPGAPALAHREVIRWFEPNHGFASRAEEPNAFGLTNAVTVVTLQPAADGTTLAWEQYYDAADLAMNKQAFDQALADIGERLVAKFGGRVVERFVQK
jgi:carbon monoxide dehydrogenase subunit G